MRRWLVAALLCAIAVTAFFAYVIVEWNESKALPQIGIFYYVWYNPNDPVSWEEPKIVDKPVLGLYDSSNLTVIRQHILSMKGLGIDFLIISWWGFYDDCGKFTDNATEQVFKVGDEMVFNTDKGMQKLKFAIMVEPFNKTGNSYDYGGIYDHVYNEYVMPYSSVYYNNGKPLICFFNDGNLTPNGRIPKDERFNALIVGQMDYAQWVYTDVNPYVAPSHTPLTNQTSVTPRFDDSRFRTPPCVVDANLTQGVYDREWNNAIQLWKEGKIGTILITSWNEYVERTAIEPHYDATAKNQDPYFLFNKTKYYIDQIRHATG